jgi:aminoglycoside phosphotransferase (APT) family kinase protein
MDERQAAHLLARVSGIGPIRRLTFIGEGVFSAAWLVDDALVCRFAKHAAAAESLRREACLLPGLAPQLPLPIPQPTCHEIPGDPPVVLGLHRLIDGEPLTRTRFARLNPERQHACAADIAGFLRALGAVDLQTARSCGLEQRDYRAHAQGIAADFDFHLAPHLQRPELAYVQSVLQSFIVRDAATCRSDTFVHADLYPHILWDARRATLTGVIDFGDMMIADAAQDLVSLYEDFGPRFMRRLLAHLPVADPEALMYRVYRLYELGWIEWAVHVFEERQTSLFDLVRAEAARLRRDAPREIWRAVLR